MALVVKVFVAEGINLPNVNDPSSPPLAYVKIKWNGQKYKTDIYKFHKWNKEFLFLWDRQKDPAVLHIEVWTSYPTVFGQHTPLGSVPIDLESLHLNSTSRAVYGLIRSQSCPGFGSRHPALKLHLQLLLRDNDNPSLTSRALLSKLPAKKGPQLIVSEKSIPKATAADLGCVKDETKRHLVKQMVQDNPSASQKDIEAALIRANYDTNAAMDHLASIMAAKFDVEGDSSNSCCGSLSLSRSEHKYKKFQIEERNTLERRKRRSHKTKGNNINDKSSNVRVDKGCKSLAEAKRSGRRREKNQCEILSQSKAEEFPYEVVGTQRKLSVHVKDRLKELLPFCSAEQIKKALKKHSSNADKALDDLLDTRIDEVGKSVAEQRLFITPVSVQQPSTIEKTFIHFLPCTSKGQPSRKVPPPTPVSKPSNTYSAHNGIRKALLIGINYLGTSKELKGCIEDTKHIRKLLTTVYGFPDHDSAITVLTDDNPNPHLQPTKRNILTAFKWLGSDAESGSALFFHYSGHGGQKFNMNGTEQDGFDETILPVDYKKKGHIIDNEIFKKLVAPLGAGVKLTCLLDCCHSGSAMDLPFIWNSNKRRWDTEITPKFAPCDVQLFSGCADEETSADFYIPQLESGGAMTKAIRLSLAANPFGHTYTSLMESVTKFLRSWGFKQTPQLSSTQRFTFERPFRLDGTISNFDTFPRAIETQRLAQDLSAPRCEVQYLAPFPYSYPAHPQHSKHRANPL